MLTFEEAREAILAAVSPLGVEAVETSELNRRVLAESLIAPLNLPVADNSSMDGYAVRAEDLRLATAENPVALKLLGKVPAGETTEVAVEEGTCMRIFTGSVLPSGADAVIMQEDTSTRGDDECVRCLDTVKPWENIRFKGEDVKAGATLLDQGTRLSARHLAVISALGTVSLKVGKQPRVALLATGHELQEAGQALPPGSIYESNRLILAELIRLIGGDPVVYPLVDDTMEATKAALQLAARECDAIVTSGGVSVGDYDLIRPAIEALGGTIDFWRVRLRPGKPFVFAHLEGKPVFGLPGNPVSAVTTYMALVRAAILKMQGASDLEPRRRPCVLSESIANRGDRPHFFRVQLDEDQGVTSAGLQGSHALQSLARADGWLCVEPGTTLDAGAAVSVMVWDD